MLDVAKLLTFRTVVRRGSFSAAAQELHLTQPAVSRQVGLLERQLGAALVLRTRQGVRCTEAGRVLLSHAEVALGQLERAEQEVRDLVGVGGGTVRLGSFLSALVHLSAEVGAVLARDHPGIRLVDDLVDRATALSRIAGGELDLAVVFENDFEPAPSAAGVEVHHLFDDPLCVVLPAGSRRPTLRRRRGSGGTTARPPAGWTSSWAGRVCARPSCSPAEATSRSRPRPWSRPDGASRWPTGSPSW
jgi:DNA-binding transcriptional LysR family regulator